MLCSLQAPGAPQRPPGRPGAAVPLRAGGGDERPGLGPGRRRPADSGSGQPAAELRRHDGAAASAAVPAPPAGGVLIGSEQQPITALLGHLLVLKGFVQIGFFDHRKSRPASCLDQNHVTRLHGDREKYLQLKFWTQFGSEPVTRPGSGHMTRYHGDQQL